MTDIIECAEAALKSDCLDSSLAVFVPPLVAELKAARAENERLHSWDGLLLILDQIYPETIFPTLSDDPGRDSGPRIISLLRQIELIRDGAE